MEKIQVPFTKSTDGVAAQPWSSNMAMLWKLFNGSYRIPWKYLTNGGLHYDYIFLLKEFMGIQRKTTLVPQLPLLVYKKIKPHQQVRYHPSQVWGTVSGKRPLIFSGNLDMVDGPYVYKDSR
jgi:hypothetical protein